MYWLFFALVIFAFIAIFAQHELVQDFASLMTVVVVAIMSEVPIIITQVLVDTVRHLR